MAVRDERPWASRAPPAAFYANSPDRKGEHARALLGSCRGFLHADGYAGFDKLHERREINGENPVRRRVVRQARTVPLLVELKTFLETTQARISRKSTLEGDPLCLVTLGRAPPLHRRRHLDMQNNAAERAMRPLALGRWIWTFARSEIGGRGHQRTRTLDQRHDA